MDTEQFIECIKKYPILYDKNHRDMKNFGRKMKAWRLVSREMGRSCDYLRMRWKCLKDGYTKYRRRSKPYMDWCWGPYMAYFDEYLTYRKLNKASFPGTEASTGSTSPSQSNPLAEEFVKTEPGILEALTSPSNITTYETFVSIEQEHPKTPEPCSRTSSIVADIEENSRPVPKRAKKNDATDYMFLSYSETFKNFSIRTQAHVKIEMAKLFAEAELQDHVMHT